MNFSVLKVYCKSVINRHRKEDPPGTSSRDPVSVDAEVVLGLINIVEAAILVERNHMKGTNETGRDYSVDFVLLGKSISDLEKVISDGDICV